MTNEFDHDPIDRLRFQGGVFLQATTFALYGRMVRVPDTKREAPIFTAFVYNGDDSIYDSRSSWDEDQLCRWLDSFGFPGFQFAVAS